MTHPARATPAGQKLRPSRPMPGLRDHHPGQLELGMEPNELRPEPVGFARGGTVPDCDQFHPMLFGKPRQLSNRLVPTTLWLMRVNCCRRRDLPRPADHGDLDAGPVPRIKPHRRTRAGGGREQQVAQVPGEHLHGGIFRRLPEPKAQVAFDVNQDPRPPGQAHCIDQPTVAGPPMIGDLEPARDLPLEGTRLASVRRDRCGHQPPGRAPPPSRRGTARGCGATAIEPEPH